MSNFLDAKCPKCGRTDQIDVAATVWLRLVDDGTDADLAEDGDHEYSPESMANCEACGHSGELQTFTPADQNGGAA